MIRIMLMLLLPFFSLQLFAFQPERAIYAPLFETAPALEQGRFDLDPKLHRTWLHHIAAINEAKGTLTLDDGSQWKLGYWYTGVLKTWHVGDEVTVAWYDLDAQLFSNVRIKNYTEKAYTWGTIQETPQVDFPAFTYIKDMPNKMTLILNDGTCVTTKQAWMFSDCNIGNVVVTLYGNQRLGNQKTSYALWDVTSRRITFDLNVDTCM